STRERPRTKLKASSTLSIISRHSIESTILRHLLCVLPILIGHSTRAHPISIHLNQIGRSKNDRPQTNNLVTVIHMPSQMISVMVSFVLRKENSMLQPCRGTNHTNSVVNPTTLVSINDHRPPIDCTVTYERNSM